MHPIVIIVFIFAGLGGAYWVLNNTATAKAIGLGTANGVWSSYGNLIIKVLFLAAIAYAVWVLFEMVKGSRLKNKAVKNVQKL